MDEAGKRPRGRPRTGVTPKRNIRVGTIWDEAAELAASRDETMTAVIERALQRYVARHRHESEVSRTVDADQGPALSH